VAGLAAGWSHRPRGAFGRAAYLGGIVVAVFVVVAAPWVAALLGAHGLVLTGLVGYLGRPRSAAAEVSSLVRRGPQVAAVLDRLRTARVVTPVSLGGCGKTRVELRVATLAVGGFRDGTRFADLASLAIPRWSPPTSPKP
jgi:hypothetical protein